MKTDGKSDRPVVAVELGGGWCKLAMVEHREGASVVTRLGAWPTDEVEAAPACLRERLKGARLRQAIVVVCLPRQAVTVRLLSLPSSDPVELEDMIDLQLGRVTPHSRSEIVFGRRLVGSARAGYTDVMLAMVQTMILRQKYLLMEQAGLTVDRMTVTTEGLLEVFRSTGSVTLVADVDAEATEWAAIRNGALLFSRTGVIGARELQEQPEHAAQRFCEEAGRVLAAFRGEQTDAVVERVVLAGAGANVAGLAERLQAETDTPVEVRASGEGLAVDPALPAFGDAPFRTLSWTGLLGAATHAERLTVHLEPETIRRRRALEDKAHALAATGALVMTIAALVSLWAEGRLLARHEILAQLRRRVAETAADAEQTENRKRLIALAAERFGSGAMPLRLLTETHRLTDASVTLEAVGMDESGRMTIRGSADAVPDILRLIGALESSPYFRNVKSAQTVSERGRTRFELQGEMEVPRS